MKRITAFQLLAIVLLVVSFPARDSAPLSAAPVQASHDGKSIGKVDLLAVLSFHPRMAFYDPALGAFYRLEISDLFRPDLELRLKAISGGPALASQSKIDPSRDPELQAIERRRGEVLRIIDTSQDPIQQAQAERELGTLAQKMAAAERSAAETSFRQNHPQVTSPVETTRIFREIEQEVLATIDQLARERNLAVVLNQSTLAPASVSSLVEVAPVPPVAASRVATSLYFAFLSATTPGTEKLELWTETVRHPQMLAKVPLRPFPLVLSGGQDLTVDVLERVLKRNSVPEEKCRQIVAYLRGILSEVR